MTPSTDPGPGRVVVEVDGVCLALDLHGPTAAPAVVLLHALGDRASTWEPLVQALAATGRH